MNEVNLPGVHSIDRVITGPVELDDLDELGESDE